MMMQMMMMMMETIMMMSMATMTFVMITTTKMATMMAIRLPGNDDVSWVLNSPVRIQVRRKANLS